MLNRSRFDGFLSQEQIDAALAVATVLGCGNLGGHAALALGKLGIPEFLLVDDDKVGAENLATQPFNNRDVGRYKVTALAKQLRAICPSTTVTTLRNRVTPSWHGRLSPVTIVAPDSIEARRIMYTTVARAGIGAVYDPLYVDLRMGFDAIEAHFVHLNSGQDSYAPEYERQLFDVTQTYANDACRATSIAAAGMVMAGLVAAQVANFARGEAIPKNFYMDIREAKITTYWRDGESRDKPCVSRASAKVTT